MTLVDKVKYLRKGFLENENARKNNHRFAKQKKLLDPEGQITEHSQRPEMGQK